MRRYCILLHFLPDVQRFVNYVTHLSGEAALVSGPYRVDARSLLGILSLDLSHPITFETTSASERIEERLRELGVLFDVDGDGVACDEEDE